jgi:4-hydroxybenzoate polyprenyltransferase
MRFLISLCIYPALGIAAFGAAIAWLAESAIWPGVGLWFAGGLLVYNLDRGVRDPSDAQNTPHRDPDRHRVTRLLVMAAAAIALALLSDRRLLGIVLPGALGCLAYSLPICGVRIKDLPAVKTLFPPLAITVAYAAIAGISDWALLSWTFLVLLFNVLLCDIRDREGDSRHGIRTLAVLLGPATRHTFIILLLLIFANSALVAPLLMIPADLYLLALLLRSPQASHCFYEWAVDGMLFVLPITIWLFSG